MMKYIKFGLGLISMIEFFDRQLLVLKLSKGQFERLERSLQENCPESPIKVVKKSLEGTFDVFTLEYNGQKLVIYLNLFSFKQVQTIDVNGAISGFTKSQLELFLDAVQQLGVRHLPEETSSKIDVESELRLEDKQREKFEKGWRCLGVAMDREC